MREGRGSDIGGAVDDLREPDPALKIALAWQPPASRPALAALFALDRRLATMVAQAKEPLLAQMRLAWWRDELGRGSSVGGHRGDPLLGLVETHWGERASQLGQLVDGWEHLLGDSPLPIEAIDAFANGRGGALAAFASLAEASASTESANAFAAGRGWALAGFASRTTNPAERETAQLLGAQLPFSPMRSRALRGVAVLGGLSRRALQRGEPLLHGRGAVLQAIRLGMFGR